MIQRISVSVFYDDFDNALYEVITLADMEILFTRCMEYIMPKKESCSTQYHVNIMITDNARMQTYNRTYRQHDYPTNILSFPLVQPGEPLLRDHQNVCMLGDMILCWPYIVQEAHNTSLSSHVHHLLIHGFLHLWHYDHHTEAQASVMESIEIALLAEYGYSNPYA